MTFRRGFAAAALALLISACGGGRGAPELAKAGAATGNALASYYDSLVDNTLDSWELEVVFDALLGVPLEKPQEALLAERIRALRSRASLGRELAAAYDALGRLASSRGAASAGEAASNLGASLQAIPAFPKSSVNPSSLLGGVAGKIVGLKQQRDLARGNETIAATLEKIRELFDREQEAYASIGRERNATSEALAAFLVKNKLVTAGPLLERVPQLTGLPWADAGRTLQDEKLLKAAVALAGLRGRKLDVAVEGAAAQVSQALALLISKHRAARETGIGIDDVLGAVQTAQGYLDDAAKLRKGGAK